MKIGIDISQVAFEHTGVSRYVERLVTSVIAHGSTHEYVLFGASLRRRHILQAFVRAIQKKYSNVTSVIVPIPPTVLDIIWNRLHIIPVEWLIGNIDVFWSSDWTQPPLAHAKGVTTIHDLVIFTYPQDASPEPHIDIKQGQFRANIVGVHTRRLYWVKRECDQIFCDSIATKDDIIKYLSIPKHKLQVVYPGYP